MLYTRSGDDGTTGLFGGGRVSKDDPRVEAYGTVDELNGCIGFAAAAADPHQLDERRLLEILTALQGRLLEAGADLATLPGSSQERHITRLSGAEVAEAESWIDEIDGANAPLKTFVLPGGSELAARLHLARGVCRRAERRVVGLAETEPVNRHALIFLNRLSDLLFAMARRANAAAGVGDIKWTGRT